MNQYDTEKGTALVSVNPDVISTDKVKQGGKISIGVPENIMWDIINGKKIPILVVVDKDEYFKREKES